MAAGVTASFSGTAGRYVGGYGQFDLYIQFKMAETYDAATRKSDLLFSDFQIKAVDDMATISSTVEGTLTVTVNGTAYTIFSAVKGAGTYMVTANGSYSTVRKSDSGAAWSYSLEGLTRGNDGKLSVEVSWDGVTLNNYYSGFAISVSGGETAALTTIAASWALSISAGTGSAISVNRGSSPNQGAFTGKLSQGAAIYYGDVLLISFSANTGYELKTHTVNGAAFASGGTLSVTAAVTVASTAALKSYSLTIDSGGHAQVSVTRNGAALSDGAAISHFDLLRVSVSPDTGYKLSAADLNGTALSPDTPVSHTVSGPVTVTVLAEALSNVFIGVDGGRKRFLLLIDDGGVRKTYRLKMGG